MIFTVEDDGIGFDPSASERGAGLSNLAHRVSAIGGTLEIEAVPGRGARITACCRARHQSTSGGCQSSARSR